MTHPDLIIVAIFVGLPALLCAVSLWAAVRIFQTFRR